jgi:FtsZ-binding cell division protein ZapB
MILENPSHSFNQISIIIRAAVINIMENNQTAAGQISLLQCQSDDLRNTANTLRNSVREVQHADNTLQQKVMQRLW